MSKRYHFVQADVFTNRPFGGNQLAVFTDAQGLSDVEMQTLAREMNFAESTFVFPPVRATSARQVRIFTPTVELPMAGHPTVGTSFVLARSGAIALHGEATEAVLDLGIGPLAVLIEHSDGQPRFVWMTQPSADFGEIRDDGDRVAGALGVTADDLADSLPLQLVSSGVPFLYVPLRSRAAVARCRPNAADLADLFVGTQPAPLLVFAMETVAPEALVHARMFGAHAVGVAEDPATGSAAGPLGAYLAHHGVLPRAPATRFVVEQGLEMGRPSLIHVEVRRTGDDISGPRVGGEAVIVGEGHIFWD